MEAKIIFHNDYCSNKEQAEIQLILNTVTELITEAMIRATAESGGKEV